MVIDSEIIKTEILRVLNESGKIRENELTSRVIKKVGNEKMVHREISLLVESGEIDKKMYSKSHIEYELINISKSVNEQLKNIHNDIETVFEEIKKFDETMYQEKMILQERVRTTIYFINIIQSTDAVMQLLSNYPTFKKDKMFSQINRKIQDCWENIMKRIAQQPEEKFFDEVIFNLRIPQIGLQNLNESN